VSLVLCRHAATNPNLSLRFLSTTDEPLGERGRQQCEELRDALATFRFERCLVSPMQRCLQTRELVVSTVPFEIEPALCEVDFGEWEGQTLDEVEAELVAQRKRDPVRFRPPGGESIEEAAARMRPLASRLKGVRDMLVIGHRVTLGTLERLLRDLPLESQHIAGLQPAEFRVVRV
jgi:broad specificity phosphatase PhoE